MDEKLRSLEFSMTIGCKLQCKYCPQDLLIKEYRKNKSKNNYIFKFEDFKKCLSQVEKGGEISFCGMSEPFHNRECADMIVYADKMGYKISLLTTLVGMTDEDFEKIKDIKFDSFVLHIPDEEGHSKFVITEDYLKLLKKINSKIKIDYYSCHGTVNSAVENIIDKNKFAGISVMNRAGNLNIEGAISKNAKGEIVCCSGSMKNLSGWSPVVFPDGSLVLCCMDYGMKHILGNLINQTWHEISQGKEYIKFIKGLSDDNIDILCRNCTSALEIENLPAMKIKRLVNKINKEELIKEKLSKYPNIKVLAKCKNVCIFGLGKLFYDHYFQFHWNELFNASYFSDNNQDKWGTEINGIKVINPLTLGKIDDLLVITFVKNDYEIRKQLEKMEIKEIININELQEELL